MRHAMAIRFTVLLAIILSSTLAQAPRPIMAVGGGGGGGGTAAPPYAATFSAVTTVTVTAATHGMGTTPVAGDCWDNGTPRLVIAQTAGYPQIAANGDTTWAWSGSKTGTCYLFNSSASGSAGGDLVGTYPNPAIAANAVTNTKVADDTLALGKLASAGKYGAGTKVPTMTTSPTSECAQFSASGILEGSGAACGVGGGGGYATIQEEASSLPQRATLNFIGPSITCVDNSGSSRTDCTLTDAGADASYRLSGTLVGQRPNLNFIPGTGMSLSLVDNPGSSRVDYTPSIDTAIVPTKANLQSGASIYATTGGTSTAYTLALNPTLLVYTTGSVLAVKFHTACGATPTLNVDTLGAKKLYKSNGTSDPAQLGANECRTAGVYLARYDAALDGAAGGFVIDIGGASGGGDDFTGTGVAHVSSGSPQTFAVTDDTIIVNNGSAPELKSVPDCTDTAGNHLNYTASTNSFSCGTSGAAASGLTPSTRRIEDHFILGGHTGYNGELGWGAASTQGTCTFGANSDEHAGHPGLAVAYTSGTSGDDCHFKSYAGSNSGVFTRIHSLGSGSGWTSWQNIWIIRPTLVTSITATVGFTGGGSHVVRAANGVYVRFSDQGLSCTAGSDSTTNWVLETISSSSNNCVDTGVAATATNWYQIDVYSTTMGTVNARISTNGGSYSSPVSSSTHVPTVSVHPVLAFTSHNTTAKTVHIDYFGLEIKGAAQ